MGQRPKLLAAGRPRPQGHRAHAPRGPGSHSFFLVLVGLFSYFVYSVSNPRSIPNPNLFLVPYPKQNPPLPNINTQAPPPLNTSNQHLSSPLRRPTPRRHTPRRAAAPPKPRLTPRLSPAPPPLCIAAAPNAAQPRALVPPPPPCVTAPPPPCVNAAVAAVRRRYRAASLLSLGSVFLINRSDSFLLYRFVFFPIFR